jgi:copper resistance protein B
MFTASTASGSQWGFMRVLATAFGLMMLMAATAEADDAGDAFRIARGDVDRGDVDGSEIVRWDAELWVVGDRNRLWLRTEGHVGDGETESAEIQALWGRSIAPDWDVVIGARFDIEPDMRTYLAAGVEGLAPYEFETALIAFLHEDGGLSARFSAAIELWPADGLALEPHLELNAYANGHDRLGVGSGVADAEFGLQLRYNATPRVAPYLDVVYERVLGETADLVRAAGDEIDQTSLRVGFRLGY